MSCARHVLVLLLAAAPAAGAQRYRVLVGEAGSSRVSLVEFRPCVPAETSDCGAFLVQSFDTPDTTMRPGAGANRVVSRRGGTIVIDGESVIVSPLGGAAKTVVSGTHGHPIALTIAADGAYAFGLFGGEGAAFELAMIDLNTCSIWAVFPLRARPAGISMAP